MTAQQQWEIPEWLEMWNEVTSHDVLSPKNNAYCYSLYTLYFLTGYVNTSVSLHLLNTCLNKVDQLVKLMFFDTVPNYISYGSCSYLLVCLYIYLFVHILLLIFLECKIRTFHQIVRSLKVIGFHLQITILQRNLKPFINGVKLTKLTTVIFLPLQNINFGISMLNDSHRIDLELMLKHRIQSE